MEKGLLEDRMKLSIYKSDCFDPYINLAIEEFLCSTENVYNGVILYLWQNQNTIVIGKNQNPYLQCNMEFINKENIKIARRLSGGGAVYHDSGNLNYTIISANETFSKEQNFSIILDALKKLGIIAECSGRNDIAVNRVKISGTAFYNNGEVSYQHGCILVDTNHEKMYHSLNIRKDKIVGKNIDSVRSRTMNLKAINSNIDVESLKNSILDCASIRFSEINTYLLEDIYCDENFKKLHSKYCSYEWIMGEQIQIKMDLYKRFLWGDCNIVFGVDNGIIDKVGIYTDSLEIQIFEMIENSLRGVHFKKTDILNVLNKMSKNSNICRDISDFINSKL